MVRAGLMWFGAYLCILSFTSGSLWFWEGDSNSPPLASAGSLLVAGAILLGIATLSSLMLGRPRSLTYTKVHNGWLLPLAITLLTVVFSDILCRDYTLFAGPTIRGELLLGAILSIIFVGPAPSRLQVILWAAVACILAFTQLMLETKGAPLFTDDHATFFFRFQLLKENFPSIPFFTPLWNGGLDARDFFATGCLGVFTFFAPLIYLLPLETVYTPMVASIPLLIAPGASYLGARLAGVAKRGAAASALLALAASLTWYRWAFSYGTLGFLFSCALFPLCLVLLTQLGSGALNEQGWGRATLTFIVTALALMWSPTFLALLPVALYCLLKTPTWIRHRNSVAVVTGVTAVTIPWVLLFLISSPVLSFLATSTHQGSNRTAAPQVEAPTGKVVPEANVPAKIDQTTQPKTLKILREASSSANPILIFIGVTGLIVMRGRNKWIFRISALWLLALGLIGPLLKPQLELDRLLLFLAMLMTIPAGRTIDLMWRIAKTNSLAAKVISFTVTAFLFATPFVVAAITCNRSLEHYTVLNKDVQQLARAIEDNAAGARGLFTGFVLHELHGGHLAPLPLFANNTPMVAHSWAHNMWSRLDVTPPEYLTRGADGFREYLDVMNIGVVVAHDAKWKKLLKANPHEFEKMNSNSQFVMFRRRNFISNYFLSGNGSILSQSTNSVLLKLSSPDGILKFTYFPFLTMANCTLTPHFVHSGTGGVMVKYQGCPVDQEIELRSVSVIDRVKLKFGVSAS